MPPRACLGEGDRPAQPDGGGAAAPARPRQSPARHRPDREAPRVRESASSRYRASRTTGRAGHRASADRSEEHTSELQSLMRISYAVFCLKKKNNHYLPHILLTVFIHLLSLSIITHTL